MHTGGTTGIPKGVMDHDNVVVLMTSCPELIYKDHDMDSFDDVYGFIDKIDFNSIKSDKFVLLRSIMEEKMYREKYDFKKYMEKNWDK